MSEQTQSLIWFCVALATLAGGAGYLLYRWAVQRQRRIWQAEADFNRHVSNILNGKREESL